MLFAISQFASEPKDWYVERFGNTHCPSSRWSSARAFNAAAMRRLSPKSRAEASASLECACAANEIALPERCQRQSLQNCRNLPLSPIFLQIARLSSRKRLRLPRSGPWRTRAAGVEKRSATCALRSEPPTRERLDREPIPQTGAARDCKPVAPGGRKPAAGLTSSGALLGLVAPRNVPAQQVFPARGPSRAKPCSLVPARPSTGRAFFAKGDVKSEMPGKQRTDHAWPGLVQAAPVRTGRTDLRATGAVVFGRQGTRSDFFHQIRQQIRVTSVPATFIIR
jgi:hypothetical protein